MIIKDSVIKENRSSHYMLRVKIKFKKNLAVTYFRMGITTLSSALNVFTSEFGMGFQVGPARYSRQETDKI